MSYDRKPSQGNCHKSTSRTLSIYLHLVLHFDSILNSFYDFHVECKITQTYSKQMNRAVSNGEGTEKCFTFLKFR